MNVGGIVKRQNARKDGRKRRHDNHHAAVINGRMPGTDTEILKFDCATLTFLTFPHGRQRR